jgi:hypothetical protein
MFSTDFQRDLQPQAIQENFQLEVLYAYIDARQKPQNKYFLLDFVEFSELDEFHTAIGNDVSILGSFIRSRKLSGLGYQ